MSCLKFFYFWKTFTTLTAPVDKFIIGFLIRFFIECVKYFVVLLITFGFGYLIFYHGNAYNQNGSWLMHDIKSGRLSSGLIQNGSLSKYPFVIEIPSKISTESLKKQFIIRQSRPQKLKDLVAQNTSNA